MSLLTSPTIIFPDLIPLLNPRFLFLAAYSTFSQGCLDVSDDHIKLRKKSLDSSPKLCLLRAFSISADDNSVIPLVWWNLGITRDSSVL